VLGGQALPIHEGPITDRLSKVDDVRDPVVGLAGQHAVLVIGVERDDDFMVVCDDARAQDPTAFVLDVANRPAHNRGERGRRR
jgi:hypothetical protein